MKDAGFPLLLDALPVPLLVLDERGLLIRANAQAQVLLARIDAQIGAPFAAALREPRTLLDRLRECRHCSQALPLRFDYILGPIACSVHANLQYVRAGEHGDACFIATLKPHVDAVRKFVTLTEQISRLDAEMARRDHAERALQDREAWLRVVLNSIADGVLTTGIDERVTWMNPVAETLTGWTAKEALGRPVQVVLELVHEVSRRSTPNPISVALRERRATGMVDDTVLLSRSGHEIAVEDSAAPLFDDRGRLVGAVIVFHDVTEKRRLSQEMAERAVRDSLTGLFNRFEFEAQLSELLGLASADGSVHSLMYVDLDHFKVVNDTCGHPVGDRMLKEVCSLLGDSVRTTDLVARLGGDEFGILLPHCDAAAALRLAHGFLERLALFRFQHEAGFFRVGASIGLVEVDGSWNNTQLLMQAADTACYAAKEAGGHQVKIWGEKSGAAEVRGRMVWVQRITEALESHQFTLHLQRIERVSRRPGPVHVEALLRMQQAEGGLIQPGVFLPAAERFRMAAAIDRWVLQHVLERLDADPRADVLVGVNFSGQSIGDRGFREAVLASLRDAGSGGCSRLCVEITETEAVSNFSDAASFMSRLRDLGVTVALDDFGAGASSFSYLRRLPIDCLKIDGQFVEGLPEDRLGAIAIRCFVDAAKLVGASCIAERVETAEALDALRLLGVDFVQGFLLHRPEPWDAVWSGLPRLPSARALPSSHRGN